MSVDPSLDELQPITLGSDSVEVMVIKFEGIVQRNRCKGTGLFCRIAFQRLVV